MESAKDDPANEKEEVKASNDVENPSSDEEEEVKEHWN